MNEELDSLAAPEAPVQADSAVAEVLPPPMPTAADLGLSVSASLASEDVTVGDTLDFTVQVSWTAPHILPLLPQSSVNVRGLDPVGLRQVSSRSVSEAGAVSKNEFVYTIAVTDTGELTIPALEFVVPFEGGRSMKVSSEAVTFRANPEWNPLPLLAGLICAVALVLAFCLRQRRRARAQRRRRAEEAAKMAVLDEMLVLKGRTGIAESREWLRSLEEAARHFAHWKFGSEDLELLFKEGKLPGWDDLLSLFAETRYGGGQKDQFALREVWKGAFALMALEEALKERE